MTVIQDTASTGIPPELTVAGANNAAADILRVRNRRVDPRRDVTEFLV